MTRERRRQLIHYHSMDSPSDVHRKIHDKSLSLDASYCVNDHVIKKNSSEVSHSAGAGVATAAALCVVVSH